MAWFQKRETVDGKDRIRAVVRVKGFKSVSKTHPNMTKAKKWAERIRAEIEDGRYFKTAEAKKHTLKELILRYEKAHHEKIESAKQNSQLRWWKEKVGHLLLSDMTPALITEYRDRLQEEITVRKIQRSPGSVKRYLAALSHVFSRAIIDYGWMEENPIRRVEKPSEPRGRVRWLDDDERNRLVDVCKAASNPSLFPVVILAISTGMRQGEIMNLKWQDVDLLKKKIVLHETKNGERRVVALAGHAHKLLMELDKVRRIDTTLLFPSKENPQKPIDLRLPWENALESAGIKNFRFHDLRHTFASYLAMDGASLSEIAEALGHKTLAMVKRYAHLSEAHTANVVNRMNEKIFG